MVIQWDEPEDQNGLVTVSSPQKIMIYLPTNIMTKVLFTFIFQGYKVYYTTNSNLPLSQWESQFVDNNKLTTVSDLVPHTIYTIRVEAYTAIGPGPPSPPVQVNNTISLPPLSTLDQIILFCLPSSLVKSEFFFNLDQKTRKIKYQNHFTNIFFHIFHKNYIIFLYLIQNFLNLT